LSRRSLSCFLVTPILKHRLSVSFPSTHALLV